MSDPQERAWYDSHRDAILAGKDDVGSSVEPATFRNVRLTPTEEIFTLIRKFNATIPFNDEPYGFFGVSRETFEHLALEEETAGEMGQLEWPDYPTFGSSDDDYETVVRPFYAAWSGFSTKKSFSWKDKYRLSDAPDRRVRRLMEKDNKKCRDDAIREFNDAVRFLVTFVRKRDPRYLPNSQTDAERQKNLRDAAAAQAARSRAANRQKFGSYELPDWSQPPDDHNQDSCFSESEEDSEIEILECVVCNKSFKSIQQLEAHERSKKHLKAVHQLRKQMKKEGVDLELDTAQGQNPDQHQNEVHLQASGSFENSSAEADCPLRAEHEQIKHRPVNGHGRGQSASSDSESDRHADEYAPSGEVDEQLDSAVSRSCGVDNIGENAEDHIIIASAQSMNLDESSTPTQNKIGKAKAKRQKKAARHAKDETQVRCWETQDWRLDTNASIGTLWRLS